MTATAVQLAKGSTLGSTLAFLRTLGGGEAEAALARMAPEERARIDAAAPTDEVPLELLLALWAAVDDEVGATHPDWPERSGALAIEATGVQLYGGILLKKSPTDCLTQRVSRFRLFYHPGDMEVVQAADGRAVLRLVGFDPVHPFFCRRQSGGLLRSVQLAGGTDASVRHVRCSLEGDAFCEWELRWTVTTP